MYQLNGQKFDVNIPQTVGDIQYPAGWFLDENARDAAGITPVAESIPAYDPLSQTITQLELALIDDVWTQQWQVVDIPLEIAAQNLAAAKRVKNAQINQWRGAANSSYFTHSGKNIACDPLSRSDIDAIGCIVSLTANFPYNFPMQWKTVDNTYIQLEDVEAFKSLYSAMVAQGTANFVRSDQLKYILSQATTQAEIDAIVW